MELLLDSSFLIFVANTPAHRFEGVKESLGRVEPAVLDAVIDELHTISSRAPAKRAKAARRALEYASRLKRISYSEGEGVDDKILKYAESSGAVVATIDSELRSRLRAVGVPVVSRRGNRLVVDGV
ncbi:MAG: PIN domain-containing protein [Nitrososphaerales archaeon]